MNLTTKSSLIFIIKNLAPSALNFYSYNYTICKKIKNILGILYIPHRHFNAHTTYYSVLKFTRRATLLFQKWQILFFHTLVIFWPHETSLVQLHSVIHLDSKCIRKLLCKVGIGLVMILRGKNK